MASTLISPLSTGEHLPPLRGEFLTGRAVQLPQAASGRVALLGLGFTYNARFPVEAWVGRFRKDFGSNPDVAFYEIPVIGEVSRLAKWMIESSMRKVTPVSDQENVITVYSDADSWKLHVGYASPDVAYLILIDRHGRVRWRNSGAFDEKIYRDLNAQVSALLREP